MREVHFEPDNCSCVHSLVFVSGLHFAIAMDTRQKQAAGLSHFSEAPVMPHSVRF
jgi:hypothetical protein